MRERDERHSLRGGVCAIDLIGATSFWLKDIGMSIPSWYGAIGLMHARHLRRRRGVSAWMMEALFGGVRRLRIRRRQRRHCRRGGTERSLRTGAPPVVVQAEAMRSK